MDIDKCEFYTKHTKYTTLNIILEGIEFFCKRLK